MTLTSKKKPIAIIGSSSMVGSRFCELASRDFKLIEADLNGVNQVDITNQNSVSKFFKKSKFEYLILFSAFTDVDEAEKQRDNKEGNCWKINVDGVNNVILACKQSARKLIFISTDFVFDGENGPYREEDPVGGDFNKISWYGITKIEGEKMIKKMLSDFVIVRISYPYRGRFERKDDFAKIILKKYEKNNLFPMFSDQFFSPTFADDLTPAIKLIIDKKKTGIFHVASPKITNPYEFTKLLIATFIGVASNVKRGSILKTGLATKRPIKGGLKSERIKNLGFLPTDWEKGIKSIYTQSNGKLI